MSCMYLAHYVLESVINIIAIVITVIVITGA